jgi:hypothetical protein
MQMKLTFLFLFFWFSSYSFIFGEDNPPKQVEIKQIFDLLDEADKVVFHKVRNNKRIILYESKNKKDISDLKQSIELKLQNPNKKCICKGNADKIDRSKGDYSFQIFQDNKVTLEIDIYSGSKIGCSLWDQTGSIANLDKWYAWFDDRNVIRPRLEPIAFNKRQEDLLDFRARWLEGMPLSIRSLWLLQDQPPYKVIEIKGFIEPLKKEFPNQNKRILAILSWYGSSAGPWSKCPDYEIAGEKMLLEYKTTEIAAAIQSIAKLTDTQKEGAVRYFSVFYSSNEKRSLNELKDPTKEMLWNFVKITKDDDKLSWAKKAFKK